jgi:hypothetical protein
LKIRQNCVASTKKGPAPVKIKINSCKVKVKKARNLLSVLSDAKLAWAPHVEQSITKANEALNVIKVIRRFLRYKECYKL